MRADLSLSLALKLEKLLHGERVAYSNLHPSLARELLAEEVIVFIGQGRKKSYQLIDDQGLRTYLAQRYDMKETLEQWIAIKSGEQTATRSQQVKTVGNSKTGRVRTFKGFLVNSIKPIQGSLQGEPFVIQPVKGTSLFIEDYEHFRIPEDVVVIGMENGENFQTISAQSYLFEGMEALFVCRYPQSKDLRTWLQQIPNHYLHFGDFDLAGISIYQTEFYIHLGQRAEFFIPPDIKTRLEKGNRALYDKQYSQYGKMEIKDTRLQPLVDMIHQYKRGYEQEGYISL